jgi:hypothetical protein
MTREQRQQHELRRALIKNLAHYRTRYRDVYAKLRYEYQVISKSNRRIGDGHLTSLQRECIRLTRKMDRIHSSLAIVNVKLGLESCDYPMWPFGNNPNFKRLSKVSANSKDVKRRCKNKKRIPSMWDSWVVLKHSA